MIERRQFGRTGHESSRVIFGAAALGSTRQEKADEVLAQVAEMGINHIDTAASYGDSELRLAPWLADHRAEVFLATKTGARSGADARAELERSLDRLGVDSVDLIQLHNLVEDDEWEQAHAPGGAVEALAAARDEGLVRFIGVTGHGLRIAAMHARSLAEFDFDSVLLPYSYSLHAIERYRTDVEALMAMCGERRVAVQTIKAVARRRWRPDGEKKFSWYEPITEPGAARRAIAWALANPQVFVNTSSDIRLLPRYAEAVAEGPPNADDLDRDAATLDIEPLFDGRDLERI